MRHTCREPLRQTRSKLKLLQSGITREAAKKGYYPDIELHERQKTVMLDNIKKLKSSGAVIGCGTDSGGAAFTVFGRFHEEIDSLLEAGFSMFEALQSATVINARILRLEDKIGIIEPGKLADFAVLDGNPFDDQTSLKRVWMVVKEGRIVHQQGQDKMPK